MQVLTGFLGHPVVTRHGHPRLRARGAAACSYADAKARSAGLTDGKQAATLGVGPLGPEPDAAALVAATKHTAVVFTTAGQAKCDRQ